LLAGQAAYRIGAGLVTCGVPTPLYGALAGQFPEGTWLLLPHEMGVIAVDAAKVVSDNLERISAVLVGPGFGVEDTTKEFLARFISAEPKRKRSGLGFVQNKPDDGSAELEKLPPLVIDADGLKLLSKIPDWSEYLGESAVLTPHPGEMAVLTGLSVKEIQADRVSVAERFAQEWGHVVILKGAHTVIAAPDGQTAIIPLASPALARAGTGDVLAGLIVGLRAQGVESFPAAVAGAWIHAQAGLTAADILGNSASVLAGDVLSAVVDVLAIL
jgi:NAD(P)H-hydrate epimerase